MSSEINGISAKLILGTYIMTPERPSFFVDVQGNELARNDVEELIFNKRSYSWNVTILQNYTHACAEQYIHTYIII